MSQKYAKDQSPGFKNHVENIAIVGAGGNMGTYITSELLKTKKHKITAVSRARANDSPGIQVPSGVIVKEVDYDNPSTLISALQGQDVLIILMSVTAPPDAQEKLIKAASAANVPWILPSEWAADPKEVQLGKDMFVGLPKKATRDFIESTGKCSWIGMVANFWYEFSLAGAPNRFGFDFLNRAVTFYGDGTEQINVSTYDQCARAVANLLSLKVLPEDEYDRSPTLSQFRNDFVYLSSFLVSQKDMFESVLRVTNTTVEDWKVDYEGCQERYDRAVARFREGDREGYIGAMYVRIFFPGGEGNYEMKGRLHNKALGLPREGLDEATKRSVEFAETGGIPY